MKYSPLETKVSQAKGYYESGDIEMEHEKLHQVKETVDDILFPEV